MIIKCSKEKIDGFRPYTVLCAIAIELQKLKIDESINIDKIIDTTGEDKNLRSIRMSISIVSDRLGIKVTSRYKDQKLFIYRLS